MLFTSVLPGKWQQSCRWPSYFSNLLLLPPPHSRKSSFITFKFNQGRPLLKTLQWLCMKPPDPTRTYKGLHNLVLPAFQFNSFNFPLLLPCSRQTYSYSSGNSPSTFPLKGFAHYLYSMPGLSLHTPHSHYTHFSQSLLKCHLLRE